MHVLLAIHSTPLLDLLREVITFFPGDEFDILRGKDSTDDTVTFMDPYMIFFAHRAQLRQSMQGNFPEEAKQHVNMLLGFLKAEHRKAVFLAVCSNPSEGSTNGPAACYTLHRH